MTDRIDELLGRMSIEEKVSMLAGSDLWHGTGVPRLGIPPIKVTDGPCGARGGRYQGGTTAACFPCGTALAATWNPELIERVGAALAEEARTKRAHVLLAPTVNIHRSPLAGRNFECYSEDPHLTARIAVAYIRGVQSRNIGACIKHFVCNDSEFERNTISSEVGERALREIYLAPFETAVKEAKPWSVMAAYNRVNGTYASEHPRLLEEILRREWGFEGLVVSDWYGTRSTAAAVEAGLDLEMPGPPRHRGEKLLDAVKAGAVAESSLDAAVRRLLELTERAGAFEHPEEEAEESIDRPEHRRLAREAAAEAIVLLKNESDLLPLDRREIGTLAVIGPSADAAHVQGGGSAGVPPHYSVTPLEGIRAGCGGEVAVCYERGCTNHKSLPAIDAGFVPSGFEVEYFEDPDLSGDPALVEHSNRIDFLWEGRIEPEVDPEIRSVRFTGTLAPLDNGAYTFALTSAGRSRLFIDGTEVIDNWTQQTRGESYFGAGTVEMKAQLEMREGEEREIRIEYCRQNPFIAGIKVGALLPVPDDLMDQAASAAAAADAAVVVVGLDNEWEGEGRDRVDMELPGLQAELIEKVAAANPNTVVVVNAGSPVAMDWLDRVPAVLDVWYPGQELGNALADVLFGEVNPSGKLPTTFPKRIEDNPAYLNYPGENGEVLYGEGIFVGYRYYDRKRIEPRFAFGHGLSYTRFRYGELRLDRDRIGMDDELEVAVDVSNEGERAGSEVVQLYLRDLECSLARPDQELEAFEKVALEPGETRTVRFTLSRPALSFWDPAREGWVAEAGQFEVRVGSSSRDIRARARFVLEGE
jgi:beta-glucosidase